MYYAEGEIDIRPAILAPGRVGSGNCAGSDPRIVSGAFQKFRPLTIPLLRRKHATIVLHLAAGSR
jgi:hypothetical protein